MSGKDTLRVLRASGSELDTAVVKATNHDIAPPKPKHLQTIKDAAADRKQLLAELFDFLSERYSTKSWMVAYKALIVTHEIMRDRDSRAMKFVALSPQILNMSSFRERCSLDGISYASGISKYAQYLEEKAATFKEAQMDFVRESRERANKLTARSDPDELIRLLNLVMRQMAALLECKYVRADLDNVIVLEVYKLLVRDLLRLYHSLNEGIIDLLELYFKLPKDVAKNALAAYKAFIKYTAQVIEFLDVGRNHEGTRELNIPVLKAPPATLVDSLQAYLDGKIAAPSNDDLPPIQRLHFNDAPSSGSDFHDAYSPSGSKTSASAAVSAAAAVAAKPAASRGGFDDFDAFSTPRAPAPAKQTAAAGFDDFGAFGGTRATAAPQQQPQQPRMQPAPAPAPAKKAAEMDLLSFDDPPPAVETKKQAVLAVASQPFGGGGAVFGAQPFGQQQGAFGQQQGAFGQQFGQQPQFGQPLQMGAFGFPAGPQYAAAPQQTPFGVPYAMQPAPGWGASAPAFPPAQMYGVPTNPFAAASGSGAFGAPAATNPFAAQPAPAKTNPFA